MTSKDGRLLTSKEAASYLGIGRHQLPGIIAQGELAFVRLPGMTRLRFTRESLDAWLRQREFESAPWQTDITISDADRDRGFKEERAGDGFVYFMRLQVPSRNHPTKIGMTKHGEDPMARMKALASGLPYPVTIIGYVRSRTPRSLEGDLHRRFAHKRLNGEWFNLLAGEIDMIISRFGENFVAASRGPIGGPNGKSQPPEVVAKFGHIEDGQNQQAQPDEA